MALGEGVVVAGLVATMMIILMAMIDMVRVLELASLGEGADGTKKSKDFKEDDGEGK